MARSIRVIYQGVHGRVRRNFNWPPLTGKSAVVITAAEWTPAGGLLAPPWADRTWAKQVPM